MGSLLFREQKIKNLTLLQEDLEDQEENHPLILVGENFIVRKRVFYVMQVVVPAFCF